MSPSVGLAQRRRHFEEWIRHTLTLGDMADRKKTGRMRGHRIDGVMFTADILTVAGDEWIARMAADLLRQARFHDVDVYPHCSKPGTWIASGLVREV